jgi:protease-4
MVDLLTTRAWALETNFFNRMAPIVMSRLASGGDLSTLIRSRDLHRPDVQAGEVYKVGKHLRFSREDGYFYQGPEDDTIYSRTRIDGVITKNGGLCSAGTYEMGEKLQMDDEKKRVLAHILEIDSGGGDVDGTKELGAIIRNLQKPVIAYVDNMAASAAYWIASQANWIVTNANNYTQVGSIGTLCILVDEREYLKKEGIKIEIMRADRSVDKARLNAWEEWPEESMQEKQDLLNRINTDFVGAVNAGRNGKLFTMSEDIFTGRMYDQERALSLGMIDQIGSLEDALQSAAHIVETTSNYYLTKR